ncbi:precorrin-6Y C5,15-methyltransferase [Vibrio sp. MACH09]|uniref:precorrin-6y C5,15-methyltransferase (decarboxylating) subunit CbiE n=1 Tax=Vibrio sp. MACH09 TaxID=3025122 RepID=UPI00278D1EDB|nr:precorrin-6y C5,15-methyltransferase (decarboxylating) subunit CbiE [Vibrio sp. MACH09]GLO63335.1 precorrin-6Y C5,15-methyltransferase [Vibrio sp. MACH09]
MIRITVVGVPEDGCMSLSSRAVSAVTQARVVAGHARHLDWFPQYQGAFLDMSQGFSSWLSQVIDESEEGGVVVLASGDPLFFGIGSTLLKKVASEELAFIPSSSSAQLAFSRLALPWSDAQFLSFHGRELQGVVSRLQQGDLFAILTDGKNTPQVIAQHLQTFNENHWQLSVCEQLGGSREKITTLTVAELASSTEPFDELNILVAKRGEQTYWGGQGQFSDDESFAKRVPHKGLITKQSVRHLVLCQLRLNRHHVMWDIGAGSGSVAIEAAKQCWKKQVFAVECNSDCFDAIEDNLHVHGTDNLQLVKEKAPQALLELPSPNAVFVGGSRGEMENILSFVWHKLLPNGRLVVSAVTLDTVAEVYQWSKQQKLNMDVQLVNISQTQPLAHYMRYQAENPIHLFTFTKPMSLEQSSATEN